MTAPSIHNFLAIDLGASNGRVVRGQLNQDRFNFQIIHRFEHAIQFIDGHKRWDWNTILHNIRAGLSQAVEQIGDEPIVSLSCDAWAQDFGLLDKTGRLIYSPVSYRDARSQKIPEDYFQQLTPDDLIRRVGGGISPISTLCQLHAMARQEPVALKNAATLLHIADLVHFDLCGKAATDWTLSTASQLRNLQTGEWDRELMTSMGIPHHFLPNMINKPGLLGSVTKEQAPHARLAGVPVVVTANHDTAAASAAAVPLDHETLFLSAGTYSMLGCVFDEPNIPKDAVSEESAILGLADRRWGVFVSIPGLWTIQEYLRCLKQDGETPISYDQLLAEAKQSRIDSRIRLSDARFHAPRNMRDEIQHACAETGVQQPRTPGEFARVIFESLVEEYQAAIDRLARLTSRRFRCLRIVSGGSRNPYLCQRLSDVLQCPVIAGPAEATAIGNILLQARVMKVISSSKHAANILQKTFPPTRYVPL
ncbi:MAG: FGGY family carbohydrate kinase [Verrucomicrobiae bacterium]|nr:FGGY family carbohydrate kinase [Verrucomicrobiae bacterium]